MEKKLFLVLGTVLLSGVLSAEEYRIDNEQGVQEVIAQITADRPDQVEFSMNSNDPEQKTAWLNGVFAGIPEDIKGKISNLSFLGNGLRTLPNLAGFTGLRSLDLGLNLFQTSPNLASFTGLQYLFLNNNHLQTPPHLADLTSLKYLDLSDNRLSVSPNLTGLMYLERVYLRNNQLQTPPDLTGLTKLKVLSLANNPLSSTLRLPSTLPRDLLITGVPAHLIVSEEIRNLEELQSFVAQTISAIYTTETPPDNLMQSIINQATVEMVGAEGTSHGISQERVQFLINKEVERRNQEALRQHYEMIRASEEELASPEDRTPVEIVTIPSHTHPIFFALGSLPDIRKLQQKGPINPSLQQARESDVVLSGSDQAVRTFEDAWQDWKQKDVNALRKFLDSLKGVDIWYRDPFIIKRDRAESFLKKIGLPDTKVDAFMSDNQEEYLEFNKLAAFIENNIEMREKLPASSATSSSSQ